MPLSALDSNSAQNPARNQVALYCKEHMHPSIDECVTAEQTDAPSLKPGLETSTLWQLFGCALVARLANDPGAAAHECKHV